jgi:RNA-directed DNA polymerase
VIAVLNRYLRGWKAYFGRTEQVRLLGDLDGWVRRRLRALQLKHWKRSGTIYRKLRALGMRRDTAWSIACSPGGWWRRARQLAAVLSPAWFDTLGLARLSA